MRVDYLFRRAARLVLLDASGRILLFLHDDPRGLLWATPGGGLEQDEDFEQAAIREALEELGLTGIELSPLWDLTVEYGPGGSRVHLERFFRVTNVEDLDLVSMATALRDEHAREGILAMRWWSVEELGSTTEMVFPENLAEKVRSWRQGAIAKPLPRSAADE
jgi:8-oxo-dGTP pyrophosphatase MutT (NUDIX family)